MNLILKCILFIPILAIGQRNARYNAVPVENVSYQSYETKSGEVISYRDSVQIGMPTGPNGFRFITWRNGTVVSNKLAGQKFPIRAIKSFRRRDRRTKIYFEIRAYGMFLIDYEMALKTGEIVSGFKQDALPSVD